MSYNKKSKMSFFMMDSTDGGGNKEAIMDYVVSWTLRMAADRRKSKNKRLHQYCRNLLLFLIEKSLSRKVHVLKVETWKQYHYIDLWVRILIEENGVVEQHEILIENKVYALLKKDRLQDYRMFFDEFLDKKFPQAKRHYLLLTCMESWDFKINKYKSALKLGFKVIPWNDMFKAIFRGKAPICSESDIFNEFWIRRWT